MDKLSKINDLYVKGWISKEEYDALYEKHAPKPSGAEQIIKLLAGMSLEELLETYKDAERLLGKAGASVIQLLITAELDKRING